LIKEFFVTLLNAPFGITRTTVLLSGRLGFLLLLVLVITQARAISVAAKPFISDSISGLPSEAGSSSRFVAQALLQEEYPSTSSANTKSHQDATDYPTITAIEQSVFKRSFASEVINTRLDRLEKNVFGYSRSQLPLVDRVDDLLSRYPLASQQASRLAASEVIQKKTQTPSSSRLYSAATNQPSSPVSSNWLAPATSTPQTVDYALLDAVTLLEQKLLPGSNRPVDNLLISERLDYIEYAILHRTFPGESSENRLARLQGLELGQKLPSRPALMDRTARQLNEGTHPAAIPPLTQPRSTSFSATGESVRRQNIQMGVGLSSHNSSQQFSPEFLALLPNAFQANQASQGSQTRIFQKNLSTEAPVLGSSSSASKRYYTGNPLFLSKAGNTPASPEFLRLERLELMLFGDPASVGSSVSARLEKLESALLQMVYTNLSTETRLNNLEKALETRNILLQSTERK
jgi:hypothetical protein